MNALFRRDYLYKFNQDSLNGISKGTLLRYINFDRKTKEYVFVEGDYKTTGELKLRISESQGGLMYSRLKKLHNIGYENTDQYLRPDKRRGTLPSVPKILLSDPKVFTSVDDLTIGKTYLITNCNHYISKEQLVLLSRSLNGGANFTYKDGTGIQRLFETTRKFTATEVN
tara:strand:+ start:384 stop:893 length:510 start_codon:yes stop_codon:yes gene_type:complete